MSLGTASVYNFLGQLIQVEDAAGIRTFSYDKIGGCKGLYKRIECPISL